MEFWKEHETTGLVDEAGLELVESKIGESYALDFVSILLLTAL